MTVAALALPTDLSGIVDTTAGRTGAWVLVESAGWVIAHGPGRAVCPPAVTSAVLTKAASPLRSAVTWRRSGQPLRGTIDGEPVVAHDLGDGATAWFIGADADESAVAALRAAVAGQEPLPDPGIADLLHPRGPRRGAAPAAVLLVVRADLPPGVLWASVRRVVATAGGRVHAEQGLMLVALAADADPQGFVDDLRELVPGAVVGRADVPVGAPDWTAAARLASMAADVAADLGLALAEPRAPRVAAELVVREARQAAADLTALLPTDPLRVLRDHDARCGGDFVATLTGWCRAGFSVPVAAPAMHLHPNTLRYRLGRLQEIAHLDLSCPRQRLAIQLLLG